MKIGKQFFSFILLYINLFSKINSYIAIPFKTFKNPEIKKPSSEAEEFLLINLNNTIYIELETGLPSQKIPALLLSEEFGFFIINHKCLIPSSFDTVEKSSTFSKSELYKDYTYNFRTQTDMIFGNDIFQFSTDSSKKQALLNFMYSPNLENNSSIKEENCNLHFADDNNHQYTCAGIGIRGAQYLGKDYEKNFIKQLFHENIINNNYFSIIYKSNDEGTFLIGEEPHIYDKKKFYEPQLRHISSIDNNFFIFWSIHPEKIFFSSNSQIFNITNNLICTLEYNLGVIYGTEVYLQLIKENYFNRLISENKCHEEIVNSIYTVFYCNNVKDIEKFPPLNFYLQQLIYTFKLDYNDLFYKHKGKYFFKVVFDKNNKNQWKLGKPFLKKYIFIYDYDSKTIGFYNEKLPRGNKEQLISSLLINIFYFFIIICFGFLGFYYGKKVYHKIRKKRINEIEDGCEYKLKNNEPVNIPSHLEMMLNPNK